MPTTTKWRSALSRRSNSLAASPARTCSCVSIDGTRDALQAIIDGKMGVTVESSPFFGPLSCEVMKRYAAGETIEPWVQVKDRIFTTENAAESIDGAY